MAFTQAELDAVEAAIASGTTSVSYEGKSVTYRSMNDLMLARYLIRRELFGIGIRRMLATTRDDKGL